MSEAIVIGTSAGALSALSALLPPLPAGYPLPILIVVHVPPDKKSNLAELLQSKCSLIIKEAEDKEPIEAGTVYIAPPDYHLQVEDDKSISLSSDEPILFSRPSIDILFETAADVYEDKLIGIILTGANNDGAAGLKAVMNAGGLAVVQNPATSYASQMPAAALDLCPEALTLDLEQMVSYLQKAASL